MKEIQGRDGVYFHRQADGSVTVRVMHRVVFRADEWAAIVAGVSARGANGSTWTEANDLHKRED